MTGVNQFKFGNNHVLQKTDFSCENSRVSRRKRASNGPEAFDGTSYPICRTRCLGESKVGVGKCGSPSRGPATTHRLPGVFFG